MSLKTIVVSLAAFVIVVLGIAILAVGRGSSSKEVVYSTRQTDRPQAETAQTSFDLGEMKVADERSHDFTLKNVGTRPLQILSATTSCMCTYGQIIYKGTKTPEFGMHSPLSQITEIAPGETASVRVIYRPSEMPVFGAVEREVYLTTNDPRNPKLVFSIRANVH